MQIETPIERLQSHGFCLLSAGEWLSWLGASDDDLRAFAGYWQDLPPDRYLKDGGGYRFRRHASAVCDPERGTLERVAHRPHWQPTTYNALHGGMLRWFEPIAPGLWNLPAFQQIIKMLAWLLGQVRTAQPWFVEAHQFRIDAGAGLGKPTPEGAHRDGVDFVALLLVERHNVEGGETTIYDLQGKPLERTVLQAPWTLMLLDDGRVMHETTPIHATAVPAYRDTLVLTYRKNGFMEPPAE
ncbi:MAG: 2OG-Fe dioxygenase family protein [Pseudomonadota bacterium]